MIGIFDSGLGGLSALKEVRRLLPSADIVYFGDTGRVPYGTRSRNTIIKYAMQDMNFLLSHNVDSVLIACGTVSSNAIEVLREKFPGTKIIGVIESGAKAAVRATKNKLVGITGTGATVNSRAFEKCLLSLDSGIKTVSTACPMFVPLVENGFISPDDEVTRLVAKRYLADIKNAGCDTLILGCTHFPIISGAIAKELPDVNLINVSAEAAKELCNELGNVSENGHTEYFVSDEPTGFEATASIFLDENISGNVTRIDIEKY